MSISLVNTRAIIFDLGGVLVDLSVEKTVQALSELSGASPRHIVEAYTKYPGFFDYERGKLSDSEFRVMLRNTFSFNASDEQIDAAWNAMLLGLPSSKLELIRKLKEKFSVYVLSNTNNIHIEYINKMMLNGLQLDTFFHKCYYSHEVGMRKPDPEIYAHVIDDIGLLPHHTIFVDDNVENIQAAAKAGISAHHIPHPDKVFDLFL